MTNKTKKQNKTVSTDSSLKEQKSSKKIERQGGYSIEIASVNGRIFTLNLPTKKDADEVFDILERKIDLSLNGSGSSYVGAWNDEKKVCINPRNICYIRKLYIAENTDEHIKAFNKEYKIGQLEEQIEKLKKEREKL